MSGNRQARLVETTVGASAARCQSPLFSGWAHGSHQGLPRYRHPMGGRDFVRFLVKISGVVAVEPKGLQGLG